MGGVRVSCIENEQGRGRGTLFSTRTDSKDERTDTQKGIKVNILTEFFLRVEKRTRKVRNPTKNEKKIEDKEKIREGHENKRY